MDSFVDDIHPYGVWRNTDPIDLTADRTRPVMLYFWRSHTPESVETLHELNEMAHRDGLPLDIIAIHAPEFDDLEDPWEDVLEQFAINLPVYHDPEHKTWHRFDVQHAPSYIVIDEHGDEVLRRVGSLEDSGVRDFLEDLQ